MSSEDDEILEEFKTESLEHLAGTEPMLLEMESTAAEQQLELVNSAFRALHSVKGAAGFFDLHLIQELAHKMESLLMQVRDGVRPYEARMTDVLLTGLDKLTRMLEALPEICELPIEDELKALTALIEDTSGEATAAPSAAPSTEEDAPERPFVLAERLDVAGAAELKQSLGSLLANGGGVELDGTGVETVDATGLQLLAALARDLRAAQRALRWSGTSSSLLQAAHVTGLAAALELEA